MILLLYNVLKLFVDQSLCSSDYGGVVQDESDKMGPDSIHFNMHDRSKKNNVGCVDNIVKGKMAHKNVLPQKRCIHFPFIIALFPAKHR